jgi:hypothetical protein
LLLELSYGTRKGHKDNNQSSEVLKAAEATKENTIAPIHPLDETNKNC